MKLKLFFVAVILTAVFCITSTALAMTAQERQTLIAQIQAQIAVLTQQLQQMLAEQQGTGSWCYTFNSNIGYANTGTNDVLNLHLALQKEGIAYSPDSINTYSTGTSQGVIQFQAKYGISPQSGYVGPLTRVKLNQLYGCATNNPITPITPNACSPNWNCANWTTCASGQQTRTCTDYNYCNTLTGKPSESQYCTSLTNSCTASCITQSDGIYTVDCYGNVTKCYQGDVCQQTYDTTYTYNNGAVQTVKTLTGSECTTPQTICTPNWQTSNWSACANSQQTRTVTDNNYCGTTANEPATTQSCTSTSAANSCTASCITQSDGVYAIDCNGTPTKCNSGEICQQTYDTSYTYNNNAVQTIKTLTGTECVVSALPYISYNGSNLYISPTDNSVNTVWGCHGTAIGAGAQSTTNGSGNTAAIVAGCSEAGAAKICSDLSYGGYDDWYLPAKDQLSTMYAQRNNVIKGDSAGTWVDFYTTDTAFRSTYWSSTEYLGSGYPEYYAWTVDFWMSGVYGNGKNLGFSVRCVRGQ